jgi:thiamine-phosphate pyrophosphorylase
MPSDVWRLIDANINRVNEGLRFLDDVARFVLDDVVLSDRLRKLRHEVAEGSADLTAVLLEHRDAGGDIGAEFEASPRSDLKALVRANFKRVQEGCRAIEEAAKLPEVSAVLDSDRFRRVRFSAYDIEKRMTPAVPGSRPRSEA